MHRAEGWIRFQRPGLRGKKEYGVSPPELRRSHAQGRAGPLSSSARHTNKSSQKIILCSLFHVDTKQICQKIYRCSTAVHLFLLSRPHNELEKVLCHLERTAGSAQFIISGNEVSNSRLWSAFPRGGTGPQATPL